MLGCLYISSFPAWTFERVGASVRPDPVVVVASGRVVAVSRSAKAAGIEVGMDAGRASTLLPERASLRQQDVRLEQAVWEEVLLELNGVTPFVEPVEPGRAFFKPPAGDVLQAWVERQRTRAGLAPDRPTARLAALRAAPGHVLAVDRAQVAPFLQRYPTARLSDLDFEADMVERLQLFGYDTLGALSALSLRHLRSQFGAEGVRLYGLLHPEEEPPVPLFRPPPSVTASYDFDQPCSEPGEILPVLDVLVEQAVRDLGGYRCRRVKIRLDDRQRPAPLLAYRVLPEPVGDARRLFRAVQTLLGTLLVPGLEVRSATLELGSLTPARPEQAGLFAERPSLLKAVRAIHRRFPGALRRAVLRRDVVFEEERVGYGEF